MNDTSRNQTTDWAGTTHPPLPSGARILSLVPSLTELVFELGLGDRLVGRTHYCIHPADRVAGVSSVGGTKKIRMDRVRALAPTHALVNIDENTTAMADALAAAGITVVVTHPVEARDNVRLYKLIGGLFGAEAAARDLCRDFEQAYGAVTAATSRRVLYLIWQDPWMTVSRETYVSRLLSLIGWRTVPITADVRYPQITLNDSLLDGVDLVLLSSEPFAFGGEHLRAFRRDYPVHANKVRLVDGEMLSWYGSRAIAGLRYLRNLADAEDASA